MTADICPEDHISVVFTSHRIALSDSIPANPLLPHSLSLIPSATAQILFTLGTGCLRIASVQEGNGFLQWGFWKLSWMETLCLPWQSPSLLWSHKYHFCALCVPRFLTFMWHLIKFQKLQKKCLMHKNNGLIQGPKTASMKTWVFSKILSHYTLMHYKKPLPSFHYVESPTCPTNLQLLAFVR